MKKILILVSSFSSVSPCSPPGPPGFSVGAGMAHAFELAGVPVILKYRSSHDKGGGGKGAAKPGVPEAPEAPESSPQPCSGRSPGRQHKCPPPFPPRSR